MNRIRRMSSCWVPALLLLSSGAALAQTAPTLLSQPAGSELRLSGDVKIRGFSPLVIDEDLRGDYVLTAVRPGFARESVRLRFTSGAGIPSVAGNGPFGSFSGAVHALFLPGIGQLGDGRPFQGLSLFSLEAMGVIFALKQDADLRAATTDYDRAVDLLDRGQGTTLTAPEQVDALVAVRRASNRVDDASSARKQWLLFSGAAWGYSFVDQVFLSRRLTVRPGAYDTLEVLLSPISKGEAVVRSLFLPGSGQVYAGHAGRGGFLLAVTGGFVGAAMFGSQHYARAQSEYDEAQYRVTELIGRTADVNVLNPARDALQLRYGDARSARRLRNILWGAAGAAWAINVLDAMVMEIPGQGGLMAAGPAKPGLFANFEPGAVMLGYRRGF